ncbi:MAG: hypothetical protein U1F43_30530 [Myxococcota bacterium]
MKSWLFIASAFLMACDPQGDADPIARPSASNAEDPAPSIRVAALDGAAPTIPYTGYLDFDGKPVNAGSVGFNFALFGCATPGPLANQCPSLWVARGTWNDAAADWRDGWPIGANTTVAVPAFGGRFSVELGGAGQNPLPDALVTDHQVLYLAVQINGKALGTIQKIAPALRSLTANASQVSARNVPGQDFIVDSRLTDEAGVQITIPTGAVIPFDLDACPAGWTEFEPAYGRFIRGVDRSGSNRDPDGERPVRNVQADMFKAHTHGYTFMLSDGSVDGVDSACFPCGDHHNVAGNTDPTGGTETRPKNVALLYCRKD